jgi:hypothetical protein
MAGRDPKPEPSREPSAPRAATAVRMRILDPRTGQPVTIEVRPR